MLSSGKYRRLVEKAKAHDFEFCFVYVYVDSVETQLDRIRARVAKGGHDVPADKVAARRERSFDQMPWFFYEADRAWVFDNSGGEPELVALRDVEIHDDDEALHRNDLLPDLAVRIFGEDWRATSEPLRKSSRPR